MLHDDEVLGDMYGLAAKQISPEPCHRVGIVTGQHRSRPAHRGHDHIVTAVVDDRTIGNRDRGAAGPQPLTVFAISWAAWAAVRCVVSTTLASRCSQVRAASA